MDCRDNKKPDPQAAWRFLPDQERKAASLLAIRQAANQKQIQKRPSFAEQAWNLIRFHTWQHWAVQGTILLFALLLSLWIVRKEADSAVSLSVCSVFLVFAGNIFQSSIAQLFSWHMAELEKTLYLDLKQMVCIRMLEAGLFDLLTLGLLSGCLGSHSQTGILMCLLYLLVPFLWSETFYLHMLTHARSTASSFRQLSCAVLCATLALFPAFWKDAYLPVHRLAWIQLSIAGCFLLFIEIYRIFRYIDTGDSLCGEQ